LGLIADFSGFDYLTTKGREMAQLRDRTILVVGATGAFGNEFTDQLTQLGASVIGTASSEASAQRLSSQLVAQYFLNLNEPGSIESFTAAIKASNVQLDGIVLAAGQVAFGSAAETPVDVTESLMRVNFLGQVSVVKALLARLEESAAANRSPFVVSLSGVIAETPMAGMTSYSASKTAMLGYATAATRELRRAGIRWIDARPGHTESGLASRAIFGTAPAFGAGLKTEDVVARIVRAIEEDEKDLPSTSFTA
jgi:cyclic-di-GMP-binding biofilm dispersal mediator protein